MLHERLIHARKRLGLTQKEVATRAGMKQTSYRQIEIGKTKKSKFINDIAKVLGVSSDWLIYGIGDGDMDGVTSSQSQTTFRVGGNTLYPLVKVAYKPLSQAQADDKADYLATHQYFEFTAEFLQQNGITQNSDNLLMAHASTNSMWYTIPSGALILIDTEEVSFSAIGHGQVYAFEVGDEILCRRAIKNIDSSITFSGDNPDKLRHHDIDINAQQFSTLKLLGRVRYIFSNI